MEELVDTAESRARLYESTLEFLPADYCNTIVIQEMMKYVSQERAYNMPECINLYEEQLHRWKMEEQMQTNNGQYY